ncbi:NAD(P)-binding protein [Delitschia confertaspora ATCC 74209]|uniref:NAD(P)-binding protein n=1 Tax=Delitschia confertaspora ATCC 74209 TaxID=1513339 RepID=A0A9P4JMV7_9PLEO|nr:NAD(P)-binding protein [Delitschia confertaspora ATCC 74209]
MGQTFKPDSSTFSSLKAGNKTVVITGGSSGIGLATATLLSDLSPKNNIVFLDLRQPPSTFKHDPSRVLFHSCDITSWPEQRAGFEAAHAKFGRIDAVFVNAGIAEYRDQFFTDELDSEGKLKELDRKVLNIDMDAAANTTKLAIHFLKKNKEGGQIVITSSLAGYLATADQPLYSAAKHGVVGLMRALKRDCAKLNIALSVVAPAITTTPILSTGEEKSKKSPEQHTKEMAAQGIPINKPESIALAVCYLFNAGIKANGAGIFIQSDRFWDMERGLAKTREQWMSKEMLDLFRGGRNASVFARL